MFELRWLVGDGRSVLQWRYYKQIGVDLSQGDPTWKDVPVAEAVFCSIGGGEYKLHSVDEITRKKDC